MGIDDGEPGPDHQGKNKIKFDFTENRVIIPDIRGVAQPGRVLALGARCRRFEPSRPDHEIQNRR